MKQQSDKTLLIRIDERQQQMYKSVDRINKKLDCKVDNDKNFKDMEEKVNNLWDSKQRMVGWMLGAGVAGGGISQILSTLVKVIQAKF